MLAFELELNAAFCSGLGFGLLQIGGGRGQARLMLGSRWDLNKDEQTQLFFGRTYTYEPIVCSKVVPTITYKYYNSL